MLFSLGDELCGGAMPTVFVLGLFRWRFLWASRMFPVTSQGDIGRQGSEDLRQTLGRLRAEDPPVQRGNRDHHAVVGAADFQRQVVARDLVSHDLFAVGRPQRGLQHRDGVERQERQAEREQRARDARYQEPTYVRISPKNPKVEDFWEKYLAWAEQHRAENTVAIHTYFWTMLIEFTKAKRMGDITREQVEAFKASAHGL